MLTVADNTYVQGAVKTEFVQKLVFSIRHIHTVAIWTFTFHKISGFKRVNLKVNFNPIYRQKLSIFLSENSDLFYSFFFYFLQNLSNTLLFTHCCCYSKELDLTNSAKNRRKMSSINLNFQVKELIVFACRLG